jgi:proline iminopeptidase
VTSRWPPAGGPLPDGRGPAREGCYRDGQNETVPSFASYDGTEIGYRTLGDGPPLVCLPGGPGRAAEYLGDLGGLAASRRLVLLDPRGVGSSADPADPASFRVDRLVSDVESLRVHLGLDRMDLLAHSAGAVLATLYAAACPQHLSALILVTPGLAAVGVEGTGEQFRAALARRAAEPWYPAALAALEQIMAGDLSMQAFRASRPFFYGRWDEAAQAHATAGVSERHQAAREGFFAGVTLDVPATRTALAKLTAPVLLHAGEVDPMVTPAAVREAAPLFNDATVVVQPGAAHFPWIDGPAAFAAAVGSFLSQPPVPA